MKSSLTTSRDHSHIHWAYLFFFFQAEDGIRDYKVTGVQTCVFRSGRVTDIPPFVETFDTANGRPGSLIVHLVAVPGRHEVLASVSMGGDIGVSRSVVPVTASEIGRAHV